MEKVKGRSEHSTNTEVARFGFGVWLGLFCLRLFNAFICVTYFDPDEYWQTLEVAHKMVFGYGWLTWEWRNSAALRSPLSFLPFAAVYYLLQYLKVDNNDIFMIYGPKVIQAAIAASIDYLTYRLALKVTKNHRIAESTLICSLISWFNLVYNVRTLSNITETLFILALLLSWPQKKNYSVKSLIVPLFFMGMAILNRPSAMAHFILPSVAFFFIGTTGFLRRLFALLLALFVGSSVIGIGILLDFWFYGEFTLSWLNFVKINVFNGISSFYGTHPWHFYILQAIPAIAGPLLPLSFLSLSVPGGNGWLLKFIGSSLFIHSLLPHKEIRFLAPLAPSIIILAGQGYRVVPQFAKGRWIFLKRLFLFSILCTNLVLAFYLTRFHQRGVIDVMNYLRTEVDNGSVKSVYFAMPCHSTPYYSLLHRNIPLKFVTCEPPINQNNLSKRYMDESDIFYQNPAAFLAKADLKKHSHIVLFESLLWLDGVKESLSRTGFRPCWETFNSHWNADWRRRGNVFIYCKQ